MRTRFDEQLEGLHVELIKMGSLCEEAISIVAKGLMEDSTVQSEKVFSLEYEIDQMEGEIEDRCTRLILQQQPVASDLRNISAALKMISDMERIGDQAADIAELIPYIAGSNLQSKLHIGEMARVTVSMVTDSIDAFVKKNLELARLVVTKDDKVDELFNTIKEELISLIYQKGVEAKAALDLLMAAKYFERIGDHAVNLAESVKYSITGLHKADEHHGKM